LPNPDEKQQSVPDLEAKFGTLLLIVATILFLTLTALQLSKGRYPDNADVTGRPVVSAWSGRV
jgi:hypothetical protein